MLLSVCLPCNDVYMKRESLTYKLSTETHVHLMNEIQWCNITYVLAVVNIDFGLVFAIYSS